MSYGTLEDALASSVRARRQLQERKSHDEVLQLVRVIIQCINDMILPRLIKRLS